jgi:hypothetical protein
MIDGHRGVGLGDDRALEDIAADETDFIGRECGSSGGC